VWSVTSFTELRRDGIEVERWNMLHPLETPRRAYVSECLEQRQGPVVAATDYLRAFADQIRQWVPGSYRVLGTDGFGRSDYRLCAGSSRSTATTSPWPRSRNSPMPA
jgi:pyruvate dehydrogenase E1 component